MLNYNLKGTGLSITPELRSYLDRKLEGIEKFLQDPSHVDVELEYQEMRHGEHYRAELTVESAGSVYRASAWGESMHAAIDVANNAVFGELSRNKKKRLHIFRRSAARVKDYIRGWRRSL